MLENDMTLPNTEEMVVRAPLNIFCTEADRYRNDVFAMSDFFGGYIRQLTLSLKDPSFLEEVSDLPVADIGVLGDVIRQADILVKGKFTFIPDFDNLPAGIRSKLKRGIYSIGQSKQVDGNYRPTILDENGVRIKDITLKKVLSSPDTIETFRSIGNQLQMRQIYAKLSDIQDMQAYQIERDRDRDIYIPFFEARTLILEAECARTEEDCMQKLKAADERLIHAITGVYTDIKTTSNAFAKKTRNPFFGFGHTGDKLARLIADDLQVATKFVGVRLQLLDYLGDTKTAESVLLQYQHTMYDFLTQPISKRGETAVSLLQGFCTYNKANRNCWYNFAKETSPALEAGIKALESGKGYVDTELYLVTGQENDDENE